MSVEQRALTQEQKNEIIDYINVNQKVSPSCNIMGGFEENVLPLKQDTPSVPIVDEPDETPVEEPKKNIIYLIENLLYLIRAGYRRRVILQSLNIIINELLMNKENIELSKLEQVNRLYYAKYLLESGKSPYYVFQTVLSIFLYVEDGLRGS